MGTVTDSAQAHYFVRTYGHILYFGAQTSGGETCNPVLKPEEAWNLDIKLDDGRPQYGKISSFKNSSAYVPNCIDASGNYNLTYGSIGCSLLFSDVF